jgi:ubiquinone/menaquinone biosynthesis C-methylase UbiE
MPTSFGSRRTESPSTYIVLDKKGQKEVVRLAIQDRIMTTAAGGVWPEQADPAVFNHVLDVGCGTGGWLIKAAQTYPAMSLVGIDISQRMVKYACAEAEASQVDDRVKFYMMDALDKLDFPIASFDLVNLRLGISFIRTWDWPRILGELLRVIRPGGVIRLTESNCVHQSNSAALTKLCEMLQCAFSRAGHLFTDESTGVIDHLARLLNEGGCEHVQTKPYAIEYQAGTVELGDFYENMMVGFQMVRPFLEKWGCVGKDYGAIYRQALKEMQQPDFHATWKLLTAWGCKPMKKS